MKKFESYSRVLPWFMALLLSALVAACGGGQAPILGAAVGVAGIPPTVTVVSPLNNATNVSINRKITAAFSKDMAPATINASTFTVACPAGTAITGTVTYVAASRIATFSHTANFPTNTICTATITTGAQDTTGLALANAFVWRFTTGLTAETTRPTVTLTVPAAGATGVAPNTKITATFSEDMDPATITGSSFTVVNTTLGGTAVAGNVAYAGVGRIATFTPTTPVTLPTNTLFTATITTGAADLAGNTLAVNKVWTFTTSTTLDTTPPTVTLVNPANLVTLVCLNKTINATFSESMDPATITTAGNYTLAPTATPGTLVNGVVAYDAQTNIASFNPVADLTGSTNYTATIKGGASGVKDLAGNALAVDKVWTFNTGTTLCQTPVPLGTSSNFAILASAAITDIPTSAITGDVGLTPDTGAKITGFSSPLTCPEVTGVIYAVDAAGPACAQINPTLIQAAKDDALVAFTYANAAARGTATAITTNLTGLTLYPGLYESLTTLDFSAGGKLYLDAQGDVNAVFILRSSTAITTLSTSEVVLTGGAKATNVFWTAGSAITLGTNSIMKGTLIAGTAITLQTGANLEGRALNQGAAAAAISLDSSTITVPLP